MLCTLKYVKRIDFTLGAFLKKKKNKKKIKTKTHKRKEEFWEVMHMFRSLVVVIVLWVYTYVQTHQDGYIKCEQFFIYQL